MEPELSPTPEAALFLRCLTEFGIRRNVVSTFNRWVDIGLMNSMNERLKWLRAGKQEGTFFIQSLVVKKPEHPLATYRHRNGKYTGKVELTIVFRPGKIGQIQPPDKIATVDAGHIPIMLGSNKCTLYDEKKSADDGYPQVVSEDKLISLGECPNDAFGYFFIKGEKTIIMQEKLRVCMILTYAADNKGTIESRITCVNSINSTIVTLGIDPKLGSLLVGLNHLRKKKYPLFLIFKAFGIDHDLATKLILHFVDKQNHRKIKSRLVVTYEHYRLYQDYVFEAIANFRDYKGKLDEFIPQMIESIQIDLYSHIGTIEKKLLTLAYQASRLLEYQIGVRSLDSRDDWGNKRIDSAGRSMEQLVIGMWNQTIEKCQVEFNQQIRENPLDVLVRVISNNKFTDDFISAFGNSAWGLKSGRSKENIVEQLRRDTPVAVISQIGRVNAPVSRHGQMRNIREIRGDQIGMVCLFETPEGDGCGIIKNVGMTCWPSIESDPRPVVDFILAQSDNITKLPTSRSFDFFKDLLAMDLSVHSYSVFVNGVLICWANGPVLRQLLIDRRRAAKIQFDVCININDKDRCLEIDTLGSRPTRPVLVVKNGKLVIDNVKDGWNMSISQLRQRGCIENIDAREQHQYFLAYSVEKFRETQALRQRLIDEVGPDEAAALIESDEIPHDKQYIRDIPRKEYDYVEIDPNVIFSMTTSHIPGTNKQQGPRSTYQCSMGKQALSQFHSNEGQRMDTSSKMLVNPSRPVVEVETSKILGLTRMPAGQTLTTAIMAHPDNPEDGIVMTKEAATLINCFTICKKTTHTIIKRREDKFCRPENKKNEKVGKYHAIGDNGLPQLDAYLGRGDCLLGRVQDDSDGRVENNSIFIGIGEEGFVDRITITNNDADYYSTIIKIKLRQFRDYKAGDKAASRYAQKGTMACIVERHTMPRVCEQWVDDDGKIHYSPNAGIVPDILINPHSFPSRMTMNKIQEILVSKAAMYTGERVNGTTFRPINMEHFQKILLDNDMRPSGKEDMEIQTYMTDRVTREKIYTGKWRKLKVPIFFGLCYYQALRHHVDDKIQYRARGAIRSITHQPVRGRSREGGIRFGEMERDAEISHGAAAILQERLCISSDRFTMPVCVTCGRVCIADYLPETTVKYSCNVCHKTNFGVVNIPYAFKLVCYMLQACSIDVRLDLRLLQDRLFA